MILGLHKRLQILIVLVLFPISVYAEVKDVESYGICEVFTDIDDFTDEMKHGLICVPDYSIKPAELMSLDKRMSRVSQDMVIVLCNEEVQHRIMMRPNLDSRSYYDGANPINVRYRFDKGDIYEESWITKNGGAITDDVEIVTGFVEELSHIEGTLVFEVKDALVRIDFTDTASADAIADYRNRCDPPRGE